MGVSSKWVAACRDFQEVFSFICPEVLWTTFVKVSWSYEVSSHANLKASTERVGMLYRWWVRDAARHGAQLWAHHRRAGCRDIAGWLIAGAVFFWIVWKVRVVIGWCDWMHIWMHFFGVFFGGFSSKKQYCWLNCCRFFFSTPLHPGRNCTSCWMTWNKVRTETIAKWQVSNGQVAAEQRQALDPCAGAVQGRREKEFTSFRTRLPGHQTSWCTWYKYTIVFAYDFSMFFMCFLCVAVG